MNSSAPQLEARGRPHSADADRIAQPGSGVEFEIASPATPSRRRPRHPAVPSPRNAIELSGMTGSRHAASRARRFPFRPFGGSAWAPRPHRAPAFADHHEVRPENQPSEMSMRSLLLFLAGLFATAFRPRLSLQLEVVALRHQLSIYQRTGRRPRIAPADRILWACLARAWSGNHLSFVKELYCMVSTRMIGAIAIMTACAT